MQQIPTQKNLFQIQNEVIDAWISGANLRPYSKAERAQIWTMADPLAKAVMAGDLTIVDIEEYTKLLREQNPDEGKESTWNLFAVYRNIAAWMRTKKPKSKRPPGWKGYVDAQGRTHVWDHRTDSELIVDYSESAQPPAVPTSSHGVPYKQLAENERLVKRVDREGYQRDFFLNPSMSSMNDEEWDEFERLTQM